MESLFLLKKLPKLFAVVIIATLFVQGCGPKSRDLPINKIKRALQKIPTYSVVLEDMNEEGNFFPNYFHKYRVVTPKETGSTDWLEVPKDYYKINETFLGMTLLAKKDGKEDSSVSPPGYQFVGDSRYGRWREDSRGGSFWEFYGKYALFSSLLGGWYRPIYRDDYRSYQRYSARNVPYFGRNREYGTSGSIARQNKPNFFSRRLNRERIRKASFSDRVKRKIGRTKTSFRSRTGGLGK